MNPFMVPTMNPVSWFFVSRPKPWLSDLVFPASPKNSSILSIMKVVDSPIIRGLRIEWLALATTRASRTPASVSIDVHLLVARQSKLERLARRTVEFGVPAPHAERG